MKGLSACGALVERHDRDRYLASLFAPEAEREHLFALYAFNHEVAKTAEVVSEPMLGQIRLQWWREALEGIYAGTPRQHEVVVPLAQCIAAKGLQRGLLERVIDAREFDLDPEPPADLDALRGYAEGTSTALLRLTLQVLEAEDAASLEAVEHLGPAWAYLGLLRTLPLHARQKRLYLPADLCADAGVDLQAVFELRTSPALRRVTGVLLDAAGQHLKAARRSAREVPRRALPALLPARLADLYLKRLRKAGGDPFAAAVQAPAPGRVWRLAWGNWRGRY
ncbi:phytoene/squalene synthase family protein [Pelagibius sp. CAU 1746]|uniref:phytoene/squalene synthase family protein n=1 Tax=Pelagibius sp. CAU 1746 TaxID=3140370 RepID=UPI00325B0B39